MISYYLFLLYLLCPFDISTLLSLRSPPESPNLQLLIHQLRLTEIHMDFPLVIGISILASVSISVSERFHPIRPFAFELITSSDRDIPPGGISVPVWRLP